MDEQEDTAHEAKEEWAARVRRSTSEWKVLQARLLVAGSKPLCPTEERRLWELSAFIALDMADAARLQGVSAAACDALEFLATGVLHALEGAPPRAFRSRHGGRTLAGAKLESVHAAASYIALAREGLIPDEGYNKTVRELFGVDRTTVQTWGAMRPWPHLGVFRDFILAQEAKPPESLAEIRLRAGRHFLANAGRTYRRGGF